MSAQPIIAGVDEAGRGPWAGPVVAAAVILPEHYELPGLNDSKKLTVKRRERLAVQIKEQALAYTVAQASAAEVDALNILQATFKAMQRTIAPLGIQPMQVLVDGNRLPELAIPAQAIVGGDGEVAAISAASILAKVARDNFMQILDKKYPRYGFAQHKGYGTKAHQTALAEFGPCPVHRQSFKPIQKFYHL